MKICYLPLLAVAEKNSLTSALETCFFFGKYQMLKKESFFDKNKSQNIKNVLFSNKNDKTSEGVVNIQQ